MKKIIITLSFLFTLFFAACSSPISSAISTTSTSAIPQNTIRTAITPHGLLSIEELETILEKEDILLVNVHIPFEGNISGTDLVVPYNEISKNSSLFPANKEQKIVVYCQAGSMGEEAAQTLTSLGYTNVWNLAGGYNAWREADLPFETK